MQGDAGKEVGIIGDAIEDDLEVALENLGGVLDGGAEK